MKHTISILLIIVATQLSAQWEQMGQTLHGEMHWDNFGCDVSLDSSGTNVIIGANMFGLIGTENGYIKVYNFKGDLWQQTGSKLEGSLLSRMGYAVDINDNGETIIAGAPFAYDYTGIAKVFQFMTDDWDEWDELSYDEENAISGRSVSINSLGDVIAYRTPNADSGGMISIYEGSVGSWSLKGSHILEPGIAIDLNSQGNRIIFRSVDSIDGTHLGCAKIFEFIDEDWQQIGNNINGDTSDIYFGHDVKLNSQGNVCIISSIINSEYASLGGQVKVFELISDEWVQKGQSLYGYTDTAYFGFSVDINAEGNRIIVGSPLYNADSIYGRAQVFDFDGSSWVQYGDDINGELLNGKFGYSVSMNKPGTIIAVGGPDYHNVTGYVNLYGCALSVPENIYESIFSIFPNPANRKLKVEIRKLNVDRLVIYNINGIKCMEIIKPKEEVDVSGLETGLYLIQINTNDGIYTEKFIKQ